MRNYLNQYINVIILFDHRMESEDKTIEINSKRKHHQSSKKHIKGI